MDEYKVTILNCIMCDDIRTEITGKEILLGVYSGNITVPRFPIKLSLAIWLQLEVNTEHALQLSFRLLNTLGTKISEVGFTLVPDQLDGADAIPAVGFAFKTGGFEIQKEGKLVLELREASGPWRVGRSLAVVAQQDSSPVSTI